MKVAFLVGTSFYDSFSVVPAEGIHLAERS